MKLIVEADGGSRGNPGPAGFGAVVRNQANGEVLAEVAEAIGVATNNVAEYRGLIAGLTAAAELAPRAAVEVRMDSKLVVEQMSGRWRIKHPDMLPLAVQARRLAAGFASVRYGWIPRERNGHADRLANEAMDAAAQGRKWTRKAERPAAAGREPDAEGDSAAGAGGEATGDGRQEAGTATGAGVVAPAAGADPAGRADPAGGVADPAGAEAPAGAARPAGEAGPAGAATLAGSAGPGWISSSTPPTATLLLRHGETPLSTERRYAGLGDIPLTERGLAQARAAAVAIDERYHVDVIVSSPLQRARRSAAEVAALVGAEVHEDEGFRETDFGKWEGLTYAEIQQRWPDDITAWRADPLYAPPGGESLAAVAGRVREARDRVLDRFRGQTVLIVCHVTPIKMMVRLALLAPPESVFRMHLDVASLTAIDWYEDGPAILRCLNDTSHLRA